MTSIYKNSTPEPVGMGHQNPRRWATQQAIEEGEEIYSNSTLSEKAEKGTPGPLVTLKKQ